jgi:hypothetical protein
LSPGSSGVPIETGHPCRHASEQWQISRHWGAKALGSGLPEISHRCTPRLQLMKTRAGLSSTVIPRVACQKAQAHPLRPRRQRPFRKDSGDVVLHQESSKCELSRHLVLRRCDATWGRLPSSLSRNDARATAGSMRCVRDERREGERFASAIGSLLVTERPVDRSRRASLTMP